MDDKMDDEVEVSKLVIHNLPEDFTTERLNDLFESFGDIVEGEFKWGVGFIGFPENEDAEEAFTKMNGYKVDGKAIKVDFPGRKLPPVPVSRLIVRNLPFSEYSVEELKELFGKYGTIEQCHYMWGYGFIKFEEETSVTESMRALKGVELTPGRKIFFELQGPGGEFAIEVSEGNISVETHASNGHAARDVYDDTNHDQKSAGERESPDDDDAASKPEDDDDEPTSAFSKIGPVRLFVGNMMEGTTEKDLKEFAQPFGKVTKALCMKKSNYGFIHFADPNACREALSELPTKLLNGRAPDVELGEIKKGGRIFVGNLHEDIDQEDLISAFLPLGPIVEYKFVRKFAFFSYDDAGHAKQAVSELNGMSVCGCRVKVELSSGQPTDRTNDACFKCGMSGHWAKECPRSGGGGGRGRLSSPPSHGGSSRVRSRSPNRDVYGKRRKGTRTR